MILFGDNTSYGTDRVDLTDRRYILPFVEDDRPFPLGVGGLLPVATQRKDGSWKTVYAFPVGEEEEDYEEESEEEITEVEAAAEVEAEAEADVESEPEVEVDAEAEPESATEAEGDSDDSDQPASLVSLTESVSFVNRLLAQAAEVSGYPFGMIGGIEVGVPERGWAFTRVEVVPLDAHGKPSVSPLHLLIETTDEPGCPDSLGAIVEYDKSGNPVHAVMTEFGDPGYSLKITVSVNEKTGKLSVQKVEEIDKLAREERLMYKRGTQPPRRDPRDRGPQDGGDPRRDDRRGDFRGDRGPRGGRDGDFRGPRDGRRDDFRRDDRRDGGFRGRGDSRDGGFRRDDRRDDRRGGGFGRDDSRGFRRDDRDGRGGRDYRDDRGPRDSRGPRDDRGNRSGGFRRDDRRGR